MTQLFQTKVCGITSIEDARMCVEAGVDAIGLNFFHASPRSISSQLAITIAEAVRGEIKLVGLFVNETLEVIRDLQTAIGFDYIQLHGDEDPYYLKNLSPLPIIKAFRCQSTDPTQIIDYLAACTTFDVSIQAILLDAYQPGAYGGTGQQLDWETLNFKSSYFGGYPVVLAGGITDENVIDAIMTARPQAVDTASGVESAPGRKDHDKVRGFSKRARLTFDSLETN